MNRISIVFFLLSVFISQSTFAQEANFNYCQKVAPWEDFVIDSTPDNTKSKMLIVTNRPYLPEEEEFLPNAIADWRKVSYFAAYCETDKWHLTFIDSIQDGLDAINTGSEDLLLFVHGHGKSFPAVMSRCGQVIERYNVSLIIFDWPSQNNDFNKSLARVRRCGENFYNLLLQLKSYRAEYMNSEQHLSILANSLGNYYLAHMVGNGNNQYINGKFIDNIVLNAAAIKAKSHGELISQITFSKRIYIALNENDRVLKGAHLLTSGKMLGNYATPPLAANAEYFHFTTIAGKQHNYFSGYYLFEYDNPAPFDFYNTSLRGRRVDVNNSFYQLRSSSDGYDIVNLELE